MPIIDPKLIDPENHELFFAIVGAVGAPIGYMEKILNEELVRRGYTFEIITLSNFLKDEDIISFKSPLPPDGCSEYERVNCMMDRGNELRKNTSSGEILALLGIKQIHRNRNFDEDSLIAKNRSFIFNQLKHPDEVFWLRKIYGSSFHLIGVYCSEKDRIGNLLMHKKMTDKEARLLIERDIGENDLFGQQLRDTFYLSDVFIKAKRDDDDSDIKNQLLRYLNLLFGENIITPTKDEFGMHLAYTTSLRSADLSRQVGSAIFSDTNELISIGCNEVPSPGGGQYWEDDPNDKRDFVLGQDENEVMKHEIVKEILFLGSDVGECDEEQQIQILDTFKDKLKGSRLLNLTEFGRSVHAEMEAILSSSRKGIPLVDCTLFVTTFPCHNCTKHIIGSGIKRLVFIEPYPKSLAKELHGDAIQLVEEEIASPGNLR